eukprot:CAMPEP_0181410446 /NCGR_PEP_ID=MMETSP1110-20121109/7342_1 /TAXON_ID=174948 /ORGANISM="Symbiodinium sp., Strain CCMP421" /LENGTH=114 /DNA_ID=CAMNT_0023532991 /DNA_START=201 /DNA_END=545 /DNA_ORIENTATION=-
MSSAVLFSLLDALLPSPRLTLLAFSTTPRLRLFAASCSSIMSATLASMLSCLSGELGLDEVALIAASSPVFILNVLSSRDSCISTSSFACIAFSGTSSAAVLRSTDLRASSSFF